MNEEAFWARVEKGDCWQWGGASNSDGYGRLYPVRNGPQVGAHRWAWTLLRGPVPPGLFVCHHCDNRLCVNPDHLYLGTQRTNMDDMVRRGRSTRGEKNPNVKLTEKQVRLLRKKWATGKWTQVQLAREFDISNIQASRICRGERWPDLDKRVTL